MHLARLKELIPTTFYAKLTLGVVLCEALIVIILESLISNDYHGIKNKTEGLSKGIPVYLIIFVFSQVFNAILILDALIQQNTIQIIGFAISNLCLFFFAVIQFNQIRDTLGDLEGFEPIRLKLIGVTVVTSLTECVYCYLGFMLYKEFGWSIYKKIGADPRMKTMYRTYQVFLMLLKLDILFFLGFSIQFLVLVLQQGDIEYPLTIMAIPLTVVILFIAGWSVRHESRAMMGVFLFGLLCGVVYFCYKIRRMYDPTQAHKYENIIKFLTTYAAMSLAALTLTFANACMCWRNFGKGLKQHLLRTNGTIQLSSSSQRIMSIE
ncbi:uncharacterized protein VTP21DRAFT_9138 [Calcarisporiella thermophila]|uniref:uncharacterized protein n=1 Tax=Calcarisporiella thermophila TaxID=911321 RepID=UPI003743C080